MSTAHHLLTQSEIIMSKNFPGSVPISKSESFPAIQEYCVMMSIYSRNRKIQEMQFLEVVK